MADKLFKTILSNGWRQGSVLSEGFTKAAGLHIDNKTTDYYVVVSHSCDLTNPDSKKELNVEVILARATSLKSDIGSYRSAKSPRILTFEAEGITKLHLITSIEDRRLVRRELFLDHLPSDEIRIPRNSVNLLARWMARRYWRPELPTEFVNRLRPTLTNLVKLAKESGPNFREILISLNDWGELALDLPYVFELKAVLKCPDECFTSSEVEHAYPENANEWVQEITKLFKPESEKIKLQAVGVDWEHDVPLTVYQSFMPFDLAYISFESGEFEPSRS